MDKVIRFSFDWEKAKKMAKNVLFFTAPALLVFIEALRQGVALDKAAYILLLAFYGLLIDFLRKLISTENVTKTG